MEKRSRAEEEGSAAGGPRKERRGTTRSSWAKWMPQVERSLLLLEQNNDVASAGVRALPHFRVGDAGAACACAGADVEPWFPQVCLAPGLYAAKVTAHQCQKFASSRALEGEWKLERTAVEKSRGEPTSAVQRPPSSCKEVRVLKFVASKVILWRALEVHRAVPHTGDHWHVFVVDDADPENAEQAVRRIALMENQTRHEGPHHAPPAPDLATVEGASSLVSLGGGDSDHALSELLDMLSETGSVSSLPISQAQRDAIRRLVDNNEAARLARVERRLDDVCALLEHLALPQMATCASSAALPATSAAVVVSPPAAQSFTRRLGEPLCDQPRTFKYKNTVCCEVAGGRVQFRRPNSTDWISLEAEASKKFLRWRDDGEQLGWEELQKAT